MSLETNKGGKEYKSKDPQMTVRIVLDNDSGGKEKE